MPVITIDVGGGSEMDLDCEKAGHAAPRRVGARGYSASGSEHAQITAELMVVPLILAPLPAATIDTIRGLFALGAQVPCAGDVFNVPGTIVCSGTITDDLHQTGDLWTANLTLFEVGTALSGPPAAVAISLTNVTSPDDLGSGLIKVATADPAGDSNGFAGVRILDAATPATCGGGSGVDCTPTLTDPSTPEQVWLTDVTLRAGYLSGRAVVGFLSKGGTRPPWATQAAMAKIFVVRSGVDVLEIDTAYTTYNGGFAGGFVTMTSPTPIIFLSQIGDRVRVEVYGRLALCGGATDDQPFALARQTLTFGNSGAGVHYGQLTIAGLAQLFLP